MLQGWLRWSVLALSDGGAISGDRITFRAYGSTWQAAVVSPGHSHRAPPPRSRRSSSEFRGCVQLDRLKRLRVRPTVATRIEMRGTNDAGQAHRLTAVIPPWVRSKPDRGPGIRSAHRKDVRQKTPDAKRHGRATTRKPYPMPAGIAPQARSSSRPSTGSVTTAVSGSRLSGSMLATLKPAPDSSDRASAAENRW